MFLFVAHPVKFAENIFFAMLKPTIGTVLLAAMLSGFYSSLCAQNNPVITIITEIGEIDVMIYCDKAPVSAGNFLRYVDSSLFNGGSFYRVVTLNNQPGDSVKIEVIQGGRRDMKAKGFTAIEHEHTGITGILHKDGVLSMARSRPGTATSEFFICIGDQPELDYGGRRNADGQGFAAFGKVIKGMDVVHAIHNFPAGNQYLAIPVRIIEVARKQYSHFIYQNGN